MTIEEMVGATMIVGLPGPVMGEEQAEHLRSIHAGGFIPFARNFSSPEQFKELLASINNALGRTALVMLDHEGGRVRRFVSGVTVFPDCLTVGRTQQPADVEQQGATEAKELRALGVHVNLAPCVDVLREGSDPVIGDRSYGSDPARVAELGVARIRGLQGHGVAACAKHFPGLGAVPKDPHVDLPTMRQDWDEMRRTHLPPFAAAIRAGVDTVMSSHVIYPQLDPSGVPATFSRRLIQELLRDEMGFYGLILTDDLEMGALKTLAPIGEAAVRAVEAGHEVLLVCSDLEAQREVFTCLVSAYHANRLSIDRLELTYHKVKKFSQKYIPK